MDKENAAARGMRALEPVGRRPGPRSLGYVKALDGVRGVAVLLVVESHTRQILASSRNESVHGGGWLGVDVFFVLSGFLITSLLLGEQVSSGKISLRGFYRRRALRLLPALVVLLAVHVVYAAATGLPIGLELRSVSATLLYVANWYTATGHRFVPELSHVWSLSIEEQFYFVWPLAIIALLSMRRSTRVVVSVLVVAIVAVTLWRALLYTDSYSFFRANPYYVRTDTRADALLIGALAAQLWVRGRVPRKGLGVGASISVVFLAVCVWSFSGATGNFLYKGGYTLIEIATAVVILALVEQRWSGTRICEWRPLQTVGRVSYGLYLWHLPVLVAVQRYGKHWRLPIRITIALSLIAAFTAASWYLVEVPMLRRKRPTPQVAEASST